MLRLAINRLAEKGEWNLDALKIEFDELILLDAPIEITGFSPAEIDQVILGDAGEGLEQGPVEPEPCATAIARIGDTFQLGPHRIACGDATDPTVLARLLEGDDLVRLVLTDEPYNVKIAGTSPADLTANSPWRRAKCQTPSSGLQRRLDEGGPGLPCEGGLLGTFIDWRGLPTVHAAATQLGLVPINLIVWAKTNAGMGSLYRSQHELLPLFKKGKAPHLNNVELGRKGSLALERLDLSRRLLARL